MFCQLLHVHVVPKSCYGIQLLVLPKLEGQGQGKTDAWGKTDTCTISHDAGWGYM